MFSKYKIIFHFSRFDGHTGIIGSFLAKLFEVTNTRQDFTEVSDDDSDYKFLLLVGGEGGMNLEKLDQSLTRSSSLKFK